MYESVQGAQSQVDIVVNANEYTIKSVEVSQLFNSLIHFLKSGESSFPGVFFYFFIFYLLSVEKRNRNQHCQLRRSTSGLKLGFRCYTAKRNVVPSCGKSAFGAVNVLRLSANCGAAPACPLNCKDTPSTFPSGLRCYTSFARD